MLELLMLIPLPPDWSSQITLSQFSQARTAGFGVRLEALVNAVDGTADREVEPKTERGPIDEKGP